MAMIEWEGGDPDEQMRKPPVITNAEPRGVSRASKPEVSAQFAALRNCIWQNTNKQNTPQTQMSDPPPKAQGKGSIFKM